MDVETKPFGVDEHVSSLDNRLRTPQQVLSQHLSNLYNERISNPHHALMAEIDRYQETLRFIETGEGNPAVAFSILEHEADSREMSVRGGRTDLGLIVQTLREVCTKIKSEHPDSFAY